MSIIWVLFRDINKSKMSVLPVPSLFTSLTDLACVDPLLSSTYSWVRQSEVSDVEVGEVCHSRDSLEV